jgi:glutamate formiminotransferase
MALVAVPNVSEGTDLHVVDLLVRSVELRARVLDVQSDGIHGRSVVTATGSPEGLVEGMVGLAVAARENLDLQTHQGVHPRLGVLDVCPFVPHEDTTLEEAIEAAQSAGKAIADAAGIPVYLYGAAARRTETTHLADLRRGGLASLAQRALTNLPPDHGSPRISISTGVVCVGARGPLIAFNVWLNCPVHYAHEIAAEVRTSGGGPSGIRALGFDMGEGRSQVSMNLTQPESTSIGAAFAAVRNAADARGCEPLRTEIVGLVPERYRPHPDTEAARLLDPPGRSLESAIR